MKVILPISITYCPDTLEKRKKSKKYVSFIVVTLHKYEDNIIENI